jgi:hypothetical protein
VSEDMGASLRDRAVVNGAASVSALRASVPSAISDWTMLTLGEQPSDGDVTCGGGCGLIPAGGNIYWQRPHPEYGDCDGYCESCAIEQGEGNKAMVEHIEKHGIGDFL